VFKKICIFIFAAFLAGHMMAPIPLDASKKSEYKAEKKKKKKKKNAKKTCGCGCGGGCKK
jgi:hypothetical protein